MYARLAFLLVLLPGLAYAQLGGQQSFEFVNIPANPRLVALGGVNVSLADEDVNFAFSNPALNGDTLSGLASFSYLDYFADVSVLSTIYQHNFNKYGSWFMGVQHINYGNFDSFDATGADLGNFNAAETQVIVGRTHTIGIFRLGATLKFLNSNIGGYAANALVADIGGIFKHPKKQFTAALAFKNIGVVLSDYTENENSKLPFDVQVGMSFKPEHMPFRFSLTGYNLAENDATFYNSADNVSEEPGSIDKAMRHLNIGAELLLSKNLNFRFGYNHLVRQELKLEETGGGAGFSFGVMFKIKTFEFAYSRGGYHAAGGSNSFSVTVNTNKLLRRN